MQYYLGIKRNEVLSHATTKMKIVCKRRGKTTTFYGLFLETSKTRKSIDRKYTNDFPQSGEDGVSLGVMKIT